MRSVKAALFFGGLWLLGACVVPDEAPVAGNKQLVDLDGREIVALCDWATDYMGGISPNAPDAPEDWESTHRCPPTPDDLREGDTDTVYVHWVAENCPGFVVAVGDAGCQLTVDDFESWVREIADDPCQPVVYSNGVCSLEWPGREQL